MELKIEYLPVDSLTPYENNSRKHSPDDIESIKISIQNDGFNDPIGIWGKDNLIVEGHGRQLAAKELGLETVPCIRLDHLTEEQRKEYAIRHNRTAELSAWDFGKLEEELASLEIQEIDMSDLKFDMGKNIDWATVDDLSESTYDEPEHEMLECPACHHVDRKIHFKKVEQ